MTETRQPLLSELKTAAARAETGYDWEEVVRLTTEALATLGGDQTVVTWREGITNGLVWFTELALMPDSEEYGVAISEIYFYK